MCIRDRVRDTSKKIKAVKRSKGMSGKPITSKPVYGYLMDEDENFIIDEEAAPVVTFVTAAFHFNGVAPLLNTST